MKVYTHGILVFVLFLTNGALNAQFTEMYWKQLGMNEGLPGPHVQTIMQDSRGYMWIGTSDGLSRFDGTHFTSFSAKSNSTDTLLINDYVLCVEELASGNLLIGTIEGFSEFDYGTSKFRNYKIELKEFSEEKRNYILGFCEWPDGSVWIGTHAGTVEWNRKKNTFEMLDESFNVGPWGTMHPYIRDENGMGAWVKLRGKIGHFDFNTKSWNIISSKYEKSEYSTGERIIDGLARDRSGVLWYTSISDSALYSFDPITGFEEEIKYYREIGGQREAISVISLEFTDDGELWMTSWNDYIRIFNTQSKTWRKIQYTITDPKHIPFSNCSDIFEASTGDIWIGHLYGISIHSPSVEAATALPVPDFEGEDKSPWYGVNELAQDPKTGILYAGCEQLGLIRYDSSLTKYETFVIKKGDEYANTVTKMHWVDGEIWCGTRNGLYIFNPSNETFRLFDPFRDGIFESTGFGGIIQTGDDVWFNCRYGRFYRYNLKNKETEVLLNDPKDNTSMTPFGVGFILKDKLGTIWMAHNKGFSSFDPTTKKFAHTTLFPDPLKFDTQAANCLIEDTDGFIWYGTRDAGIYRINQQTGEYKQWEHPKLRGFNYVVVLAADENYVWFGSRKGIFRFDKVSLELEYFFHDRSMLEVVLFHEGLKLVDGRIVFFANHRLLLVAPEKGKLNSSIENPLISEVRSGEKSYLNVNGKVYLSKDQNYFSILFSSVADASRSDIIYEYQLVGVDKDWVAANNRTEAAYNNIPGGEYTFKVRAKGASGNWVETSAPFSIAIEKRFVETILFKALLFLILITCLTIIIFWRRRIERRLTRERALNYFVDTNTQQSISEIGRDMAAIFVDDLSMVFAAVFIGKTDNHEYVKISERGNSQYPDGLLNFPESLSGSIADITQKLSLLERFNGSTITPLVHEGRSMGLTVSKSKNAKIARENQKTVQAIAMVCAGKIATIKADNEVKQKEEVLAQINSLLTESQLVSLRAQMNPHFVFNCLNSIQESIVMKQYNEASLYLNKFSKLFRMVLNNSSRDLITLKEEMDVLALYLELEHMRFQKSFDYSLECDDELESDEILVPSMLLQPFVENALWHGLLHKDSDRQLNIRFYARDEEIFVCEIEDNGIGREHAGQIKQQKSQTTSYESKGIKISMDRLNLINLKQNKHARVEIVDKKDESGSPTGTKVIFEISQFLHQIQTSK